MCSIALHMQIEGEIHQAILMIKFSLYRVNYCRARSYQILIATMQLSAAVTTEAINIMLICNETTVKGIVTNFVQLITITYIDDFYA